jgi:hypothetical protein
MIRISDAPGMMTDHPLKDIAALEGIEIRHIETFEKVENTAGNQIW